MKHSVEKATAETEEKLFKLFLTQTAKNLLNFLLGVRVYHNFLPWICPVRNLPIGSNTRDFPDNIHVKTTYRLESLHNLMSTLQRWLQSLDPLLTRTWLLTSRHYAPINVNPVEGGVRARGGDSTNFKIFWSNSPGWETKGQSKVSKKPPPQGKNLNKQYYNTI